MEIFSKKTLTKPFFYVILWLQKKDEVIFMKGLDQRYIWVVTNEKFEKALKASKAERNSRVIPSPFFSGVMTFSAEQDLQDFFYVLLKPYFDNWSRRQALYFSFASADLLLAHLYVKQHLRPFEERVVQMSVEEIKNVSES
jgi:hypothetical protein